MNCKHLLYAMLTVFGPLVMTSPLHAMERADHFGFGFDLDGEHQAVPCESCHARGVFKGTPRECGYCHDGTGIYASSFRSLGHPLTTENCESCHTTGNWVAVSHVDHGEVLGSCTSCHSDRQAEGLPAGHIQTIEECGSCHTDVSWIPVLYFDHAGVIGGCVDCHNGSTATGKHPQHISSNSICDDCHTTDAWVPAVFDHGSVSPGTCESCHDGMTATGKHPQHLVTSTSCDACHSALAWVPAIFDHADITPGTCASCHDGVTATGMSSGHFMTSQSCDDCHSTTFWTPDQFVHTSPVYPGDHAGNLACTGCHQSNAELVSWTSPAYQPDCAGCHANDFRSGPHKKHESPDVSYTVAELRDCTGACHIHTDSTLSTISEFRPGPEHSVLSREF